MAESAISSIVEHHSGPSRVLQPGDGAYLASSQSEHTTALGSNARRNGVRGRGRGRGRAGQSAVNGRLGAPLESVGDGSGPVRLAQPRKLEMTRPESARGGASDGERNSKSKEKPARRRPGHLDPTAASFTPSTDPTMSHTAPHSRGQSPSQPNRPRHQSDGEGSQGGKSRRRSKPARAAISSPSSPAPLKSSRRAAFERQARLTTAETDDTDGDVTAEDALNEPKRNGRARRQKQDEKDDWISKLTRGLKSRPFIDCPIVSTALACGGDRN